MATLPIRSRWYTASHAKWEGSQTKRGLVGFALCVYVNDSQQEHVIQIGVVYNSFPDLQVLVVRIERLVGRPSDMLSETDVPCSA